jgi:hypothetical protein
VAAVPPEDCVPSETPEAGGCSDPPSCERCERVRPAICSASDVLRTTFLVPDASGPSNALGVAGAATVEGRAGTLAGLPVFVDSQIPTNVNSNQDVVLVLNTAETYLYESSVRVRVLPEVLSGTLSCRIQLYGLRGDVDEASEVDRDHFGSRTRAADFHMMSGVNVPPLGAFSTGSSAGSGREGHSGAFTPFESR